MSIGAWRRTTAPFTVALLAVVRITLLSVPALCDRWQKRRTVVGCSIWRQNKHRSRKLLLELRHPLLTIKTEQD